jgi:LmbE family N-acetylglucosaminyl deacetylase
VPDRPPLVALFVAAHPDDDVMGAAGLIALRRDDPGLRFVLVHATDGAAGEIAAGSGATRETLGAVRREEDRRGWAVVGRMPDRHEWLGLPDGSVQDHSTTLTERLTAILAEERPDVVWTCGPDGTSGHPDHIAVSLATTAAFHAVRATGGPGLRRLLNSAIPQSVFEQLNARRVAAGQPAWDPTRVYHLRGLPDELFDYLVDQRAVVRRIRDAFFEHRSQWAPPWSESSDAEWRSNAGMQHLIQVWPPRERGLPRLRDPFEGLDVGAGAAAAGVEADG